MFALAVRGADDDALERRFARPRVQYVLFSAMAAAFDPDAAAGFRGKVSYELTRPHAGAPPARWTVEISDRRARARRGGDEDAELQLRFTLADFVRVAAGTLDPSVPLLQNRASFKGDLGLAVRLPEMFGASSAR
jgi:hypothetical protein